LILGFLLEFITNYFNFFLFFVEEIVEEVLVLWTNHRIKITCIKLFHHFNFPTELISIRTHIAIIVVEDGPIQGIINDKFTS